MATHSSIFAWRIPWTEEPGGLQSTGSQSQTRLSDFTHSLRSITMNKASGDHGIPTELFQILKDDAIKVLD